jgi:DNA mismatch repair ATPase MutS
VSKKVLEVFEFFYSSKKKDANIVNREVDKIISIGTVIDPDILDNDDANYLISIKEDPMENKFGFT